MFWRKQDEIYKLFTKLIIDTCGKILKDLGGNIIYRYEYQENWGSVNLNNRRFFIIMTDVPIIRITKNAYEFILGGDFNKIATNYYMIILSLQFFRPCRFYTHLRKHLNISEKELKVKLQKLIIENL